MAHILFVDESGTDGKTYNRESLAGLVVPDYNLWCLVRSISDLENKIFGTDVLSQGSELKGKKLLKKKVFKHLKYQAMSTDLKDLDIRRNLTRQCLQGGKHNSSREHLKALALSKIEFVKSAISLLKEHGCRVIGTVIQSGVKKPTKDDYLRKDYVYLFERFYYDLRCISENEQGFLVLDEFDKKLSDKLLNQVQSYFIRTETGKQRASQVVPDPFFVHSDLTKCVQIVDIFAYLFIASYELPVVDCPGIMREEEEMVELAKMTNSYLVQNYPLQESNKTAFGVTYIDELGK